MWQSAPSGPRAVGVMVPSWGRAGGRALKWGLHLQKVMRSRWPPAAPRDSAEGAPSTCSLCSPLRRPAQMDQGRAGEGRAGGQAGSEAACRSLARESRLQAEHLSPQRKSDGCGSHFSAHQPGPPCARVCVCVW